MQTIIDENIKKVLEDTFNLSNQAIYWLDKEGKLLFANSCALNTLGYDLEELQKLNVWDVDAIVNTKEKYYDAVKHFEINGPDGLPNVIETEHKRKDNTTFPVEVISKFTTINNIEYLISYTKDITERIKKDNDIKFYFSLINSSKDMIFLANYETEYIEFANETACDKLGFSLDELKNMKVGDFRAPLESLDNKEISEVFKTIRKNKDMITFGVYTAKDGTKVPVETSLHLNKHYNEKFITAISRDISERLEIENKKDELSKKLKNYNETLEYEINRAKDELLEYEKIIQKQSKMAAMGEMLENISHQWRQPLSAISVLSTGLILQDEQNKLTKEFLSEGLTDINKQVQYLSTTIDDFRNFFKPNKAKNRFTTKGIINVLLSLTQAKFNNEDISIITEVEEIELFSYENELLQVLLNLVANAKDAFHFKKYDKFIFIKTYTKEGYLVFEFKDNAGGIKEDVIDRIFEPYFTTKHSYSGTGIGLYMSEKIIVDQIKGTILAENTKYEYNNSMHKGAIFKVSIPI